MMATVLNPPQFAPAAAGCIAANLLNRHSPHEIAEAIEVLVDVLDLIGGDPDAEANGDELDGSSAEDEFKDHERCGPGCQISDPGEDEHDRERDEGDL